MLCTIFVVVIVSVPFAIYIDVPVPPLVKEEVRRVCVLFILHFDR